MAGAGLRLRDRLPDHRPGGQARAFGAELPRRRLNVGGEWEGRHRRAGPHAQPRDGRGRSTPSSSASSWRTGLDAHCEHARAAGAQHHRRARRTSSTARAPIASSTRKATSGTSARTSAWSRGEEMEKATGPEDPHLAGGGRIMSDRGPRLPASSRCSGTDEPRAAIAWLETGASASRSRMLVEDDGGGGDPLRAALRQRRDHDGRAS